MLTGACTALQVNEDVIHFKFDKISKRGWSSVSIVLVFGSADIMLSLQRALAKLLQPILNSQFHLQFIEAARAWGLNCEPLRDEHLSHNERERVLKRFATLDAKHLPECSIHAFLLLGQIQMICRKILAVVRED